MATCREMELQMSLALDGLADDEEQRALQAHLTTCEDCARVWEAMRRASTILSTSTMAEPPAGFVRSVMERVQAQRRSSERWMGGMVVFAGTAGLLVALLLMAGLWLGGLWAGFPALRSTTAAFVVQAGAGMKGLLAGLQVPLRLLGPAPIACTLSLLFVLASSAASIWAWVLVQVERQARSAVTSARAG